MPGNEAIAALVERQRNRTLASILSVKDQCDQYLPRDLRYLLRKTILDQVNALSTFTLDVMKALDDDTVIVNPDWIEMLAERVAAQING